jgi:hypothetical protein
MATLDQAVPTTGPLTAAQLTAEINAELSELFRRSFVKVTGAAGTNNYTATIPLNRPLEDGNGFIMEVPNSNTGASNFNGKPLVTSEAAVLQSGQLSTGQTILFTYDQSSDHYRLVAVNSTGAGSSPVVTVYTNSTTWTKPAGLRYVRARVQAGGGGGDSNTGTPGGGGSYGERIIAASLIGASVSVTVGGGGAGGIYPGGSGGNGGGSSFGSFVSTNGGTGGFTGGGTGGAAGSGGDLNLPGGDSNQASPKRGGDSFLGFGGAGQVGVVGKPGTGYGGGGNSGGGTGNGGAGAPGAVIVEEYYA